VGVVTVAAALGTACGSSSITANETAGDALTDTLPAVAATAMPPNSATSDEVSVTRTGSDLVRDLPWPDDLAQPSDMEIALRLSASDPLGTYTSRAESLTVACMTHAGFDYAVGDVLDQQGLIALTDTVVDLAGLRIDGGCSTWGMSAAFPGNYFGNDYQLLVDDATLRPEISTSVRAYDQCLFEVGIFGPPVVSGLSDFDADAAIVRYNELTSICYTSSGRKSADRALETLVGDAFVAAHGPQVDEYVANVLSLIEEP